MKTNEDNEVEDHILLEDLCQKHFGYGLYRFSEIQAGGSDRRIYRIHNESNSSFVGIVNLNREENKAFINFARHFKKYNLNVPEIYAVSNDLTHYITQDLGSKSLLNLTMKGFTAEVVNLYREVIDYLIRFQTEAGSDIDYRLCYQFAEFGSENIDYDFNYFRINFLENFVEEYDMLLLLNDFELIKKEILSFENNFFLYRDFQSRNIMIENGIPYFIDFQSGRKGALLYDIASLLYDAKANIPQDIRDELFQYYLSRVSERFSVNLEKYHNGFWFFCIIRILQALGAYGYVGITKGRKEFLDSIPYALKNINYILSSQIREDKLQYLGKIFSKLNNIPSKSL